MHKQIIVFKRGEQKLRIDRVKLIAEMARQDTAIVHEGCGCFATAGTFEDFSVVEFGEGASK